MVKLIPTRPLRHVWPKIALENHTHAPAVHEKSHIYIKVEKIDNYNNVSKNFLHNWSNPLEQNYFALIALRYIPHIVLTLVTTTKFLIFRYIVLIWNGVVTIYPTINSALEEGII